MWLLVVVVVVVVAAAVVVVVAVVFVVVVVVASLRLLCRTKQVQTSQATCRKHANSSGNSGGDLTGWYKTSKV